MLERTAAALVGAALLALAAAEPAAAACQFATGGNGLAVTVAVRAEGGQRLSVDWGDGTTTATARSITPNRARLHVRHVYAAAGQYQIVMRTSGGATTCQVGLLASVPYDGGDDADSRALLPPADAPASSDAEFVSDADEPEPTAVVRQPTLPRGLERAGEATGGVIRSILSWFFGPQ